MTQTTQTAKPRNRWSLFIWGGAAALLLIPLVAMQFTREVNWTVSDFAIMGGLLASVCGVYEIATRISDNAAYRAAAAVAIVAAFLLTWVNLAVGIIGSEDNPENLLFGGVILVGLIGAVIARFRPAGMAWALIAMAIAQAAIAVRIYLDGDRVAVLAAVFVVPWLSSAALFQLAARMQAHQR